MTRIHITKTPKCYVGGAFIRSESGRVTELRDSEGGFLANIPQCTRKDLRNAVEAAAKAGPGWAKRSAFNRGQILYRLAEMIEARGNELRDALVMGGAKGGDATREVTTAIDRIVHYAGWTDKYEQVLGSVNPVASAHFNFTVTEPVGIIGVIAPDASPLLALVSLILPAITSGNCVVALASTTQPYPSILLGEMLATSDLPGGVVNLLTGFRHELIPTFATHEHLRALSGVVNADDRKTLRLGAAESVKRVHLLKAEETIDWFADGRQGVEEIRALVEFKTTWHPVGA
ncbi:aldehyde dehydrogenase family protein [Brevifollis gellanilyticus]|uniref:Aldehyde dehydrogenase n=1 Tax=Brevifollis gellanilyticus TaxID=748831 RepID=A0A512MD26_9BACT|nr:aldehyde dehydrogenase family protein [Brevifollis gellanilyticus]GEP44635.1 aldehyde dehydrogenase [Brevifollis gellanilyticus]